MGDGYNVIQDSGINQVLGRRLNTTSGPASSLAPEVMPIVPAQNWDAANEYLAGTRLCAARVSTTAGAGQYAGVRVRCGRASGIIAVIEQIVVSYGAPGEMQWGLTTVDADLATLQSSGSRDGRQPPIFGATQQTTASVSSVNTAATPTFTTNGIATGFAAMTSTSLVIPLNYVLVPGVNFEVWTDIARTLRLHVQWSERRLQPSELG